MTSMQRLRAALPVLTIIALSVTVAACGGEKTEKVSAAKLVAPEAIAARGTITYCTELGYPPLEFKDPSGKLVGADIEIGRALAQRMGVKAKFRDTTFDGIIEALEAGSCDAIISSMTNNAERRKRVRFIDYLRFGQSMLVQTSNEHDIQSLDDLAGLSVSVQSGTVNEDYLRAEAKTRNWGAKGPPKVQAFQSDKPATDSLAQGKVAAYFGDSPAAAYYISQEALTYAFAGKPINPEPIGIAVRPNEPLAAQLQLGIDDMYEDGSMSKILERWNLSDFKR